MAERVNRQWLLKKRPQGMMTEADFERVESAVPELESGQALVKNLLLSFDPTQRGWAALDTYMPAVELGTPMRAFAMGQVVSSKSKKYKEGDLVAGLFGWQDYAIIGSGVQGHIEPSVVPAFLDQELTLAFLLTGLTAYFGMLDIGKPKKGDVCLVSGAAGATGSIAAQLARIRGARVIGIAGGKDKCSWLKQVAGLDAVIDYKNEDVLARIKETCPQGIDVFYDNVGGQILDAALLNLAQGARIVLCGAISQYNAGMSSEDFGTADVYGVKGTTMLIIARASMTGFIVGDYMHRATEGLLMLNKWHDEGRLVQEIDVQEGFENIPATLTRLFEGKNLGKQLLRLAHPDMPLNDSAIVRMGFKLMQKITAFRHG